MRDLIKLFLIGAVLFFIPFTYAAEKKTVLILPDNVVTEDAALDSYIYNQTAEFFSNEIITLLNKTDYIKCPTVSDERSLLKSTPSFMIPARDLTNRFKSTYNIDYNKLTKVAKVTKSRYVLLLTSTLDAENYILRRTLWDFLNIAGATVVDPAYKINTYAVLVDTQNNSVLWSNTFYKTISAVESRILTRGPSPQTQQLEKIRDYSRMLSPEIAQNVQLNVLTSGEYAKESYKIYYDMGNFDNIFTKKHRRWSREGKKDFNALKGKFKKGRARRAERRVEKQAQKQVQKQVQAEIKQQKTVQPQTKVIQPETKIQDPTKIIQPLDFEDQSLFDPVYIKKHRKNNLYQDYDVTRPPLRDYDKL